jgi:type IV secretory pathway TrbF-like protein
MAANPSIQFEDEQIRSQNRNVWHIALASIAANVVLAVVVAILALRPRTLPYLVEVNTRGEPVAVVQPVLGTQALNDATIRWALAEFIHNAFSVTANADEERENLHNAVAFMRGQAHKALKQWYNDGVHYPITVAQKHWIDVHVTRVLRLPVPSTYQIDWESTTHDYNSDRTTTTNWRATVKVEVDPTSHDPRNPLSLYVTTIDFAPES